jgi:hypothetical protein
MHGISVLSCKSLLTSRIKSDIEMYSDMWQTLCLLSSAAVMVSTFLMKASKNEVKVSFWQPRFKCLLSKTSSESLDNMTCLTLES